MKTIIATSLLVIFWVSFLTNYDTKRKKVPTGVQQAFLAHFPQAQAFNQNVTQQGKYVFGFVDKNNQTKQVKFNKYRKWESIATEISLNAMPTTIKQHINEHYPAFNDITCFQVMNIDKEKKYEVKVTYNYFGHHLFFDEQGRKITTKTFSSTTE